MPSGPVDLEAELAPCYRKDAALLFTSGYKANEAKLTTLRCHRRVHTTTGSFS